MVYIHRSLNINGSKLRYVVQLIILLIQYALFSNYTKTKTNKQTNQTFKYAAAANEWVYLLETLITSFA